jgi:hypothetical protein
LELSTEDRPESNAVVLGLFARHIVIPLIDDAEVSDYATPVIKLTKDLRPQSTLEEFYVLEIAKKPRPTPSAAARLFPSEGPV